MYVVDCLVFVRYACCTTVFHHLLQEKNSDDKVNEVTVFGVPVTAFVDLGGSISCQIVRSHNCLCYSDTSSTALAWDLFPKTLGPAPC